MNCLISVILLMPALSLIVNNNPDVSIMKLPEITSSNCCIWYETSWQDFVDGELDPALFVSRRAETDCTPGAIEFSAYFDVNKDGWYDFTTTDWFGPNCHIYLGGPAGYSSSNRLTYPIPSGGSAIFADLNLDRNPEMLLPGNNYNNLTIYQGTLNGPSPSDTFSLIGPGMNEAVFCADIDRDAYLDIIVGYCTNGAAVGVFWGSENGYSSANKTIIPLGANVCFNLEVADLDQDGWQEIVFVRDYNNGIIHWGPNRQYRVENLIYPAPHPHGLTVADFNADGWLDIVCTDYASSFDQTYIYWGSNQGFNSSNLTILNVGEVYGGTAAADFNRDGLLDIVMFLGYDIYARPMIFFNTGSYPYFDISHSTEIGPIDMCASGGIAADLNFDGYVDLFVNNREPNGYSYVLWGPEFIEYDALPAHWDHHGTFREPGNIYDRSLTANYYSSIYDIGQGNVISLAWSVWNAREPEGARVLIAYRTGNTPEPDSTWTDFAQVSHNGGFVPQNALGGRYIQYRATFCWTRPNALPELEGILTFMLPTNNSELTKFETSHQWQNLTVGDRQSTFQRYQINDQPIKFTIIDATGRVLRNEKINLQAKDFNHNLSSLSKGVYFVKIETDEKSITKKVVVTK